jgi:hypothetical protein
MSEQAVEQTDDDGFTYEVSDDALEVAGGVKEVSGGFSAVTQLITTPLYCFCC